MRHFFFRLSSIIADISYILSPEYKINNRTQLLCDYLRLRFKVFLNRWVYFKTEHFLSFTVVFANYSLFFETFRQTFIRHSYYFKTDTQTPTIIDCGGNAGLSVLYFKYLFPGSKITVFEPSEAIQPIIRENISRNKLENVTLEPYAVSKTDGTASFYDRGTGSCGNTLIETVFDNTKQKGSEKKDDMTHVVKTRRLSTYIKSTIDLLKLDIEGAEGLVIEELKEAGVLQKINTVVMEYHYYPSNIDNHLGKILSTFEKEGRDYQIYLDELTPGASMILSEDNGGYYSLIRSVVTKK